MLIFVIVIFAVIFAGAACFLGIRMKSRRILKYIPAGVAASTALGFYIKAMSFSEGFGALGNFILAMISAAVFAAALLAALIMELVNRRR